ncbi:MAG TPA: hypothetical protein VLX31_01280 [Streptosporangiaceae bacterium]|nr:hypothetical protein [Streptosporangiaceae bacterium]
MRHLIGLLLALATAAALFFAACWGIGQITTLHGPGAGLGTGHLTSVHGLAAIAALIGTGLLIGVALAAPRISPLAGGLPGLVLLAWTGLVIAHSALALRYLPLPGSEDSTVLVYLLVHGILGLLGAAMIVPVLVPSRWRRPEYEEDDEEDFSVPAALGLVP